MALQYTVGMCPKPIVDDAVEYDHRKQSVEVSENDGSVEVTIYMCQNGSECHEGLMIAIGMCPLAEICGCNYEVANFRWLDAGSCGITFEWNNPDRCILYKVNLQRISWWDSGWFSKYIHTRFGDDPTMPIYPDDDARNQEGCRDCGIGGNVDTHEAGSELVYESTAMVPGQLYKILGWFDDQSCGGRETPVDIGYVLYQTTGLSSGKIVSKLQDNPPKYRVEHYFRQGEAGYALASSDCFSVDYYDYQVGDPVMLCKHGTQFPGTGEDHRPYGGNIGNSSVEQKTVGDSPDDSHYFISAYQEIVGK